MILSQEYHQLHPSDNDNFGVNNNKTRLICFISLLRINSFCQDCYENHWWWNTVSVNSKTWMVTERHHFLSLMFCFVACVCVCECVCVCVCVCVYMFHYFVRVSIFTLTHGLFKLIAFIIYFILILLLLILLKKWGFKIQKIQKKIIQKQNKK